MSERRKLSLGGANVHLGLKSAFLQNSCCADGNKCLQNKLFQAMLLLQEEVSAASGAAPDQDVAGEFDMVEGEL